MTFRNLLFIVFISILHGCSEQSEEYEIPKLEEVSSDSLVWIPLMESQKNGNYFILEGQVYCGEVAYNSYPLEEINTESFEVLSGTEYARDKNHVLYPLTNICVDGKNWGNCHCVEYIIEGADPKSFEYAGDEYSLDKTSTYFRGIRIKELSPAEFELLGDDYARDSSQLFFRGKPLENIALLEFQNLSQGYASNYEFVLYNGKILEGVDPSTFIVSDHGMASDSSKTFSYGTLEPK